MAFNPDDYADTPITKSSGFNPDDFKDEVKGLPFKQPEIAKDVGEFFGEGMAGQAIKGRASFDPKRHEGVEVFKPKAKEPPAMSFKDSMSAIGEALTTHPLETIGSMVKEIARDPELLYPGLWEVAPVRIAGALGKAATIGKAAAKAGAIGAVAETAVEASKSYDVDTQKVLASGAMFAGGGSALHAIGGGFKGIRNAAFRNKKTGEVINSDAKHNEELKTNKDLEQGFQTRDGSFVDRQEAAKIAEEFHKEDLSSPIDREKGPSEGEEAGLHTSNFGEDRLNNLSAKNAVLDEIDNSVKASEEQQPLTKDFLNPQKELAYPDRNITPDRERLRETKELSLKDQAKQDVEGKLKTSGKDNFDVIVKSLRHIRYNETAADQWANNVKRAIPEEVIRERMFRAQEGEKKFDTLITDEAKDKLLNGTGKTNENWYIDSGLKGALKGIDRKLSIKDDPTLKDKRDKLDFVIRRLESQPSEDHAIPILEDIDNRLKKLGQLAKDEGLLKETLDNYVPHILDFSKSKISPEEWERIKDEKMSGVKQLSDEERKARNLANRETIQSYDPTRNRLYETSRELEEAVKGTGIRVQTDIADSIRSYEKALNKARVHNLMIKHFETELAPTKKGKMGYITSDFEAGIKEGYVPFQGKGSKALEGKLVHPDLVSQIEHVFLQKDPHAIIAGMAAISNFTKSLNVMASLFHMVSLGSAHLTAAPLSAMKEAFTAGDGIKAAIEGFKYGNETTNLLIKNGLMVSQEDIVHKSVIGKAAQWIDNKVVEQLPEGTSPKLLQRLSDPAEKYIINPINKGTWDFMHVGQKLHLGNKFFTDMKTKNPDMPDADIAKEVSSFINNSFGGLDWTAIANDTNNNLLKTIATKATSLKGRQLGQILLFAADWTVSTARATTEALPKNTFSKDIFNPTKWELKEGVKGFLNPRNRHDLARRYVLNTAIMYFTLMNGINYAFSGHPIYQNKNKTKIDLGDGTTMQINKHGMEAAEWGQDFFKTLGNKQGMWPKLASIIVTGRSAFWNDRTTIPKEPDEWNITSKAKAAASLMLPFSLNASIEAPTGESAKRALSSFVGLPIEGRTNKANSSLSVNLKRQAEARRRKNIRIQEKLDKLGE